MNGERRGPFKDGAAVVRGTLGWGNPGCRSSCSLDTYGPGGRWGGDTRAGDLLADALARAGATEGATLLVIAVPRFGNVSFLDEVAAFVAEREPPLRSEESTR